MDTLQVSKKSTANKEKPMNDSMIENEMYCIRTGYIILFKQNACNSDELFNFHLFSDFVLD